MAVAAGSGAIARAPSGRVVGVGVTGMAETGALLDSGGAVVTPGIAWHDRRGEQEAKLLGSDLPRNASAR